MFDTGFNGAHDLYTKICIIIPIISVVQRINIRSCGKNRIKRKRDGTTPREKHRLYASSSVEFPAFEYGKLKSKRNEYADNMAGSFSSVTRIADETGTNSLPRGEGCAGQCW